MQVGGGEVAAFLGEVGLSRYLEALLATGFDDMDTLLHMEDADMRDAGMGPSHVAKLRRRLQELLRQSGEGPELDASNPVVAFLSEVGLGQYAEALLQSGFDELDVLLDIKDDDMKDLGIPRGHVVKLRRRLQKHLAPQACAPHGTAAQHATVVPLPQPRPLPVPSMARPAGRDRAPDEHAKSAVGRSWERVQALGTYAVGEMLYKHTFELEPEVMMLFPAEVRFRYREWTADEASGENSIYESPALRKLFSKFVNAIGSTVAGLHDFGRLVPMLTQLGARHANYGLDEGHWPILGKALLMTLQDCLGSEFTPEVETAWSTVYGFMSNIMIAGLRGAREGNVRRSGAGTAASGDDDCRSEDGTLSTGLPSESGGSGGAPIAGLAEAAEPEGARAGAPTA